jgi:hypothetical protein
MAFTSKLFITETYLHLKKLNSIIFSYLENTNHNTDNHELDISIIAQNTDLEEVFNKNLNLGRIIEYEFSDKDDFRTISLELYQKFETKTYIFLGDINNYSIPLQEGMLKLIEEPPENLQIVVYCQNTNKILPTIKSRCQIEILPPSLILSTLNEELSQKVKEKLPIVSEFCKEFLKNNIDFTFFNQIDLKNVEREEIDFWLWQALFYIKQIYLNNKANRLISVKIEKILQAKALNFANLQKKFVLESLFV